MALLSVFGKRGVKLNLLTKKIHIEDTEYLSKYFAIAEYDSVFTAGKNAVAFNGSALLKDKSEILVECLDSQGNSLHLEQAKAESGTYTDASKFVVSVHVYEETYNGPGKFILVGTTKKGETVRWVGSITIDKTLSNASKVRFYNKPTLEVRPLLYPVVDTRLAEVEYPPPPSSKTATAKVNVFSRVVSIKVDTGGSGYTSVPFVGITGGGGATATATIVDGKVNSITVTNEGSGYTSVPTVVILGGAGTGSTATATLLSTVETIDIIDGGSGYSAEPIVTIRGSSGTGATATSTISGGKVTEITVTNKGSGYTSVPTVIIASPTETPPPELNVEIDFEASFYSEAVTPRRDALKSLLDTKRTDIDYRIILTGLSSDDLTSSLSPIKGFNSQMEGQIVTLYIDKVKEPYRNRELSTNITSSFTLNNVLNSQTAVLNQPFYYAYGKNQIVSNIISGKCKISYRFIYYNTNPDSNRTLELETGDQVDITDSYAEITYRNLRTFSGFIARHKLYRRSSYYPGEFQLISDEPLGSSELLEDEITFNRFYNRMGVFYNQAHVEKYWFTSSNDIHLEALANPLNAMRVYADDPSTFDGNEYVIVKDDTIGGVNDKTYYPYYEPEFNRLSGSSYNSNFISLKKDASYIFSTNLIVEKDPSDTTAKIEFYFTSSIESIQEEPAYTPQYGMKLGEISIPDKVSTKYFDEKQVKFFTPQEDYYGTLVVVPYKCNITLFDISLKVYGDKGFSPDVLFIKIPFDINVKNEAFEIRAELFDVNANLVYSDLKTTETFDELGESLYKKAADVSDSITVIQIQDITLKGDLFLPDLQNCPDAPKRFVGWQIPIDDIDGTEGRLCYTNVSQLYIEESDYIVLSSFDSGIEETAKSIAVKYDLINGLGRKVFVDEAGTKTEINPWF